MPGSSPPKITAGPVEAQVLAGKRSLRVLLGDRRLDAIAGQAATRKGVLSNLVSLTFDAEPLIVWRAIEALGVVADRIAEEDPAYVRNCLRRLHWSLSDESGAICWHAPEAIAEIVRRRPALFTDYVPIVVSLLRSLEPEDLVRFRAGILWGIGRLGSVAIREVDAVLPLIGACLTDRDSQVRGRAAWCLEQVGRAALVATQPSLRVDCGEVDLYDFETGEVVRLSVGEVVRRVLDAHPLG